MTDSEGEMQISKKVLLETLGGFLSPDKDEKKKAVEKIKELQSKVPDEFLIHLANFVIHHESSTSVRKLAARMLRQYICVQWSPSTQLPEIGSETKKMIRELLLPGLCEADSEMRNLMADLIDTIARSDWPDSWPNFFDTLVEYLHSEKEFAILGSMGVLRLLSTQLTAAQLIDVAPVILREMYRIFENTDIFLTQIRSQAVHVFLDMVNSVIRRHDKQTDLVQQVLEPSIELFCSKFSEILRVQNDVGTETEIKYRMIYAIDNLTYRLPKSISTFLPAMLPSIWEIFIDSAKVYRKHIINVSGDIDVDGIKATILAIFELIKTLMIGTTDKQTANMPEYDISESEYFDLRSSFRPEMLQHLLTFIEMTDNQFQPLADDEYRLVTDETLMDGCGQLNYYSVRREARITLFIILDHSEGTATVNALCDLIQKQIQTGNSMRSSSDSELSQNWWKLHEASIQAFDVMENIFAQQLSAGTSNFYVTSFLENVVLADLDDPDVHPALHNTCLFVGASYIEQMPVYLMSKFVKSIINCVKNRPTHARICAARVARYWIRSVLDQENNHENENILKDQLPALIEAIFDLGSQLMSLDKSLTASMESSICTLTIAVHSEYRSDERIVELCQTISSKLSQNTACSGLLQARLVPILIARLAADPRKVSSDVFIDLETLQILVKQSPQPLSSILIENAFPALCRFILSSKEHTEYFLDRACTVLHSYLSVGVRLVIDYRDNDGKTGLQYILQIVDHLFGAATENHQNLSEACEILTKLIATGTILGQKLDQLLKVMLSYTQHAESVFASFDTEAHDQRAVRALWVVWARLFETEFDAVLEFLSTAQGPDGQSALAIVISNVFRNVLDSPSLEDGCRTVIRTAVGKIVDYGVSHLDSTLHEIEFHETKEGAKEAVPILVKISELASYELQAIHRATIIRPQVE